MIITRYITKILQHPGQLWKHLIKETARAGLCANSNECLSRQEVARERMKAHKPRAIYSIHPELKLEFGTLREPERRE